MMSQQPIHINQTVGFILRARSRERKEDEAAHSARRRKN